MSRKDPAVTASDGHRVGRRAAAHALALRRRTARLRAVGLEIGGRRLYTASLADVGRGSTLILFFATLARSHEDFRWKMVELTGDRLASLASVHEGVDHGDPLALSLLSPLMTALLEKVEKDPNGAHGDGFELWVEQRRALR